MSSGAPPRARNVYDKAAPTLELPTDFRMPAPSRGQLVAAASVAPAARVQYAPAGALLAIVRAFQRAGRLLVSLLVLAMVLGFSCPASARHPRAHTPRAAHTGHGARKAHARSGPRKPTTLGRAARAKARAAAHPRAHHHARPRASTPHPPPARRPAKPVKRHGRTSSSCVCARDGIS
jgi:hypothetical protein